MGGPVTSEPRMPAGCERGQCDGMPPAEWYADGTIWQCGHCGREWIVWSANQCGHPFSAWRRGDS